MLITIPYVLKTLQITLDDVFGVNVFTLIIDTVNPEDPKFYLECADSTPQSSIDQAKILADENAQDFLQRNQIRLYEVLNTVANNVILQKEKPAFNNDDVQAATAWLQDQSLPCPGCVIFVSIRDNISKQQAAQNVINYQTDYENFVNQVNTIKLSGQNELMDTNDVMVAKNITQSTRIQLENLA